MYCEYLVNIKTGELLHISLPDDKPDGDEWQIIGFGEWLFYQAIAHNTKNH